MEAISREFRVALPWELLYADDLAVIAETEEELIRDLMNGKITWRVKLELVDKFCYLGDMLSMDGDADAAVEARIRIGWNKFRWLVPLLANKDVSLVMRGRLYSSCVRSSMLHGSETWPVRKESVVALRQAEMRMVRWMCGIKLKDRLPIKELRERLCIDDIALVLQQNRLRWYVHVLRKEGDDWVKKCIAYEVEGPRPRGRPKRTWREVVKEDCQVRKMNREDAIYHCKWRKMIKDVRLLSDDQDGCEWVSVSSGTSLLG